MDGNKRKQGRVDPTVQCLVDLFPEEYLREQARETGILKRERRVDIVILFWVLVLGFGIGLLRSLRGMKRKYNEEAGDTVTISSFYNRFTDDMVKFLKRCVVHAIEVQSNEDVRGLNKKLSFAKDILIQDNTIIRLHDSLAKDWPAVRSRKIAAGLKISTLVSVVSDSVKSVKMVPERTADIKTLRIGPWVKDKILLIDLGFFGYSVFERIERNGGYFVSRLKSNANPMVVASNINHRGRSIDVVGKRINDILPELKRGILDVVVEVDVKRRAYKGKRTTVKKQYRVVCVRNIDDGEYHTYITNINPDRIESKDVAALYRTRWEIEIIFKEMKSNYHMDKITSANKNVIQSLLLVSILTLLSSHRILNLLRRYDPENAHRRTRSRWAKVFEEHSQRHLHEVIQAYGLDISLSELMMLYVDEGSDPNVNRDRMMDEWTA